MKMSKSDAGKKGGSTSGKQQHVARINRIKEYDLSPVLCNECSSALEYDKRKFKFCSRSCAASFNNKKSPKRKCDSKQCAECSKDISSSRRFCGRICESLFRAKERDSKIEKGDVLWPRLLREYLIRTRGYACAICNNNGIYNNLPLVLDLDHIDGDSDNCKPENLRFLCPNCHRQQPTSKGGRINKKFNRRNLVMHRRAKSFKI